MNNSSFNDMFKLQQRSRVATLSNINSAKRFQQNMSHYMDSQGQQDSSTESDSEVDNSMFYNVDCILKPRNENLFSMG